MVSNPSVYSFQSAQYRRSDPFQQNSRRISLFLCNSWPTEHNLPYQRLAKLWPGFRPQSLHSNNTDKSINRLLTNFIYPGSLSALLSVRLFEVLIVSLLAQQNWGRPTIRPVITHDSTVSVYDYSILDNRFADSIDKHLLESNDSIFSHFEIDRNFRYYLSSRRYCATQPGLLWLLVHSSKQTSRPKLHLHDSKSSFHVYPGHHLLFAQIFRSTKLWKLADPQPPSPSS